MKHSNALEGSEVPGEDARRQCRELMQQLRVSQTRAAKFIGISSGTLSAWLAGDYKGDNAGVERRVRQWLDGEQERADARGRRLVAADFVETKNAKRALAAFRHAKHLGDMIAVVGPPGTGKTTAAREFARDSNNVWVVTMAPYTSTLVPALNRIASTLELQPRGSGAAAAALAIIEAIKDSRGVLILDEAQHLTVDALNGIRSMYDDAAGVGLVLLGSEDLITRVLGGRNLGRTAQLRSRLSVRRTLALPTREDVKQIAAPFGVVDDESIKYLADIAARPGAFRLVVKCLQLADMMAQAEDETLSIDYLRDAWENLGGGE